MELAETARIYRHAMQQLPYNWRQIMLMRGEEEMSYEQIARILGTTESSVRGTLSKAKKRMLNLIKQKLEE
ncbi:MAG: RNA polymerase sigma factor [Bacteroidaceae bacterium]